MNKKIWLTGGLSILAIFLTVFIYNNFIMDKDAAEAARAAAEAEAEAALPAAYVQKGAPFDSLSGTSGGTVEYSNDIFTAVFSADGAVLTSLKLNEYRTDSGDAAEMVFSGGSGIYPFSLYNGGYDSSVINGRFEGRLRGNDVVFTGRFGDQSGNIFEIVKTWHFEAGSYMIAFDIEIRPVEGSLPLGDGEHLYSLGFGPQLGPEIDHLNRGYIYRYFCLSDAGEKRNVGTPEEQLVLELETPFAWMGLESRYFVTAAVPVSADFTPAWDERKVAGLFKRNAFFIQRNAAEGRVSDRYYVYFGPKDAAVLDTFDDASANPYGLSNTELGLVTDQSGIIRILSTAVKAVLNLLNKVIPNYGLDIILFALIIQVLIYPISRRTYDNAIRMQLLGPALGELKKQYKYNDQKRSEESRKLFEENNVRPRSSLAPFIIHLPFFILTYVLLLTDIDFRLAAFIPGWINDIALPEYIIDIAPMQIPITAWDKIRILPVVVLAVSLIQSRYIQAPADSIQSMRIMSYIVPVVMFIVIYNMPSGAVLYWLTMTATNLLLQWRIKAKYAAQK